MLFDETLIELFHTDGSFMRILKCFVMKKMAFFLTQFIFFDNGHVAHQIDRYDKRNLIQLKKFTLGSNW